jgi:endonuclease YncB( thermonuclease family)
MGHRAALTAILLLLSPEAVAQTVVDGDTITLDGIRWRLWDIDAPETQQRCADGWPAGLEATVAMRRLIEGREVVCELRGRDRYGRSIGLSEAGGRI